MPEISLPAPEQIPSEDIPLIVLHLVTLQGQLLARLLTERAAKQDESAQKAVAESDVMLTAKEAAPILNVRPAWFYRNAKTLPFARRLSRKQLRFSKHGLISWRDKKRG